VRFDRDAGEDAAQFHQRRAEVDALRVEPDLADRLLVRATALLQRRDRLLHPSLVFVQPHHHHRIGEVARVHRRAHRRAHHPRLRRHEERGDAVVVEVGQQLAQLHHEETILGHRVEVAVEAVDDHDPGPVALD
jgi:hypothetical protein